MITLTLSFFITAILYAAVGFGGGSTYNALLVLAETNYRLLPTIALICNLIVVSGGTYRFYRAGHINFKHIAPWIITSIPAAWLGGMLNISETLFIGLLGISLLVASMRMLWQKKGKAELTPTIINQYRFLPPIIGAFLGLLAGLVGIGGGIFLAPILYLIHWGDAKKIAATCSVFILLNSLAGLSGQIMKLDTMDMLANITNYWVLFLVVLIGGQIGSTMGAVKLNPKILRLLTALLILYVSVHLLFRWYGMIV